MSRVYTLETGHVTESVRETSVGAVEADKIVDALTDELVTVDHAWLKFVELAARYGHRSEACASFVKTLAKRAAAKAGA